MPTPLLDRARDGKTPRHHSVGAVIERGGAYLLIERTQIPLGFAGLAGHVDVGEDAQAALIREVQEESELAVTSADILFAEEVEDNTCGYGVSVHFWTLYQCFTTGEPAMHDHEAKSMGWYTGVEIQELHTKNRLEPVWQHWFRKLGVLD